jgi:aminoglycoside 3'-phosphotransferase II
VVRLLLGLNEMVALSIPDELQPQRRGYTLRPDAVGKSGNNVYRLDAPRRPALIAKIFERAASDDAGREAARLAWLRQVGMPAPQTLGVARTATHVWLLTECLPGSNAAISSDEPAIKTQVVAEALARLHVLPIASCPFDETLSKKLARAEVNVRDGVVDELDFDQDHLGLTASQLFKELKALHPGSENLVVTHGDASLPNFMLDDGCFTGFVDCGKLGRSDRYQDLAICCRSIRC